MLCWKQRMKRALAALDSEPRSLALTQMTLLKCYCWCGCEGPQQIQKTWACGDEPEQDGLAAVAVGGTVRRLAHVVVQSSGEAWGCYSMRVFAGALTTAYDRRFSQLLQADGLLKASASLACHCCPSLCL